MGSLLASLDFLTASMLVIQQYNVGVSLNLGEELLDSDLEANY